MCGLIHVLNMPKRGAGEVKNILMATFLILKMANSVGKECQKQKRSGLNYLEYTKNESIFAKFAQVGFSS